MNENKEVVNWFNEVFEEAMKSADIPASFIRRNKDAKVTMVSMKRIDKEDLLGSKDNEQQ